MLGQGSKQGPISSKFVVSRGPNLNFDLTETSIDWNLTSRGVFCSATTRIILMYAREAEHEIFATCSSHAEVDAMGFCSQGRSTITKSKDHHKLQDR